jgi:hypothetical protein
VWQRLLPRKFRLPFGGLGDQASEFLAMTTGHSIPVLEHPAQALGWLDLLVQLMPPTVTIEASSWLVLAVLMAIWIWRR